VFGTYSYVQSIWVSRLLQFLCDLFYYITYLFILSFVVREGVFMNLSTTVQSDKTFVVGIVAYSNVSSFFTYKPRVRNYVTLNIHL